MGESAQQPRLRAIAVPAASVARVARLLPREILATIVAVTLGCAGSAAAQQQKPNTASSATPGEQTICARQAPWNKPDNTGKPAAQTEQTPARRPPSLLSGSPIATLTGKWKFELKGIEAGGDRPTAGYVGFYQFDDGYSCNTGWCQYTPSAANAKWLANGLQWGEKNYGQRTEDNPEGIPEHVITVTDSGTITFAKGLFPTPEIHAQFDPASPDRFAGTWSYGSGKERKSGQAVFTRVKPKFTAAKFSSNIENKVRPPAKGCVAMDYSGSWGAGNDMRGNRPGFDVEVRVENLPDVGRTARAWIDRATGLEIDSGGPEYLFVKDAKGQRTDQIAGLRMHVNIGPAATPGPRTLYIEGQPVPFDFYADGWDKTVDLAIGTLPAPAASKGVVVLVQNRGPAEATKLSFNLSSQDTICPYGGGCDGDAQGLAPEMDVCPLADGGPDKECTECKLSAETPNGPLDSTYECPFTRLGPGKVVKARIEIDPRPKTGAAPTAAAPKCAAPHQLSISVAAAETDSDKTNNQTVDDSLPEGPMVKKLRILALGDKDWHQDELAPADEVYAGEEVVVEASLDRPICQQRYESGAMHRTPWTNLDFVKPGSRPPPESYGDWLWVIPRSASVVRSAPFFVDEIFDAAHATLKQGAVLEAVSEGKRASIRVADYPDAVAVKLTPLGPFDEPLDTRKLAPGQTFTAEAAFLDGQGPFPAQTSTLVTILRQRRGALPKRERLRLKRRSPGRYVSEPTTPYALYPADQPSGKAGDVLIEKYLYAPPPVTGNDRLTVFDDGKPDGRILGLKRWPYGHGELQDYGIRIGTTAYFELNSKPEAKLPGQMKVVVVARHRESGKVFARIDMIATPPKTSFNYPGAFIKGFVVRGLTDDIAVGTTGPLADVKVGDEIRAEAVDFSAVTAGNVTDWQPIFSPQGTPLAIQVLPVEPPESAESGDILPGGTFQVRLAFNPDDAPDVAALPATLSREHDGDMLAERKVILHLVKSAPGYYLSKVLDAGPATFPGGVEPKDVVRAVYVREKDMSEFPAEKEVEGQAAVVTPEPVVKSLTLSAGGTTDGNASSGAGGRVATDGAFRATVKFKTPPYGDLDQLGIRVVHDGAAPVELIDDLSWQDDTKTTAVSKVLSLADDARFGKIAVGDRIEARYGDGKWAPMPSAGLDVVGTAGKIADMHFLIDGKPATELPVGSKPAVEVVYEKAPETSPASLTVETGADFRSFRYRPGGQNSSFEQLSAVAGDPLRFRTVPITLAGATQPEKDDQSYLSVMPGYRLTATLGKKKIEVPVVAGEAAEGEATLTVTALDGYDHESDALISATGKNGGGEFNFLTNKPVHLPAGAYTLNIDFAVKYKTGIELKDGEKRTFAIPKGDIGSLHVDLLDGRGMPRTPEHISAFRTGGGPEGWEQNGYVANATIMHEIPRGTYDVDVSESGPNGVEQKLEFTGVVIQGGAVAQLKAGHDRGQLKVILNDAGGKPLKRGFTVAGVHGQTSADPVDVPAGDYGGRVQIAGPFTPVVQKAVVESGAPTEQTVTLGRLEVIAYDSSGKVAAEPVSVARDKDAAALATEWKGAAGTLDVPAGTYHVTFSNANEIQDETVAAGQTIKVEQKARLGRLVIKPGTALAQRKAFVSSGYVITSGGKQVARPPTYRSAPLDLAPGTYVVNVLDGSNNLPQISGQATVTAGKTTTLTLDNYGSLVISDPLAGKRQKTQELEIRKEGTSRFVFLAHLYDRPQQTFLLPPGRYDLRRTAGLQGVTWQQSIDVAKGISIPVEQPK